jgi:hypothetical protein
MQMGNLERAIEIAAAAHAGQTGKTGAPYIAHPMRLMARFLRDKHEKYAIIAAPDRSRLRKKYSEALYLISVTPIPL